MAEKKRKAKRSLFSSTKIQEATKKTKEKNKKAKRRARPTKPAPKSWLLRRRQRLHLRPTKRRNRR